VPLASSLFVPAPRSLGASLFVNEVCPLSLASILLALTFSLSSLGLADTGQTESFPHPFFPMLSRRFLLTHAEICQLLVAGAAIWNSNILLQTTTNAWEENLLAIPLAIRIVSFDHIE